MNICYSAMLSGVDMGSVMNNGMSISEKLSFSGRMLLMGMGTVFAVLLIIWGVLSLFRVFMYDVPNKRKAAKAAKEAAKTPVVPVVEEVPVAVAEPETVPAEDDKAIIAVITAAISAYRSAESGGTAYALPFRVVSYKRKKSGTAWNGAVND